MVTSQDAATAVALTELDVDYDDTSIEVVYVEPGQPAEDKLEVRDIFRADRRATDPSHRGHHRRDRPARGASPLTFRMLRGRELVEVEITPRQIEGDLRIGVAAGDRASSSRSRCGSTSTPTSGAPVPGLMFSLAIYDTLTKGSLTGGEMVAGTGSIDASGAVGPIGGVQQKIAGARDDGADLFLVPPDNCEEALGADPGDMRLVRADTMHDARLAIEAWVDDEDADLPSCEDAA